MKAGNGSLTVIGALRCVSGVAGDIEHGAHDSYIGGIGRAVACDWEDFLVTLAFRVKGAPITIALCEMGEADWSVLGRIKFRGLFRREAFGWLGFSHDPGKGLLAVE